MKIQHRVGSLVLILGLLLTTGCSIENNSDPAASEVVSAAESSTAESGAADSSAAESSATESNEGSKPEDSSALGESLEEVSEPDIADNAATLVADFSCGGEVQVKNYPFEYQGELSATDLAMGLTDLTGLDFKITAEVVGDGIRIDWSSDSSLIAGLGDRKPNEGFELTDVNTLEWFMMDSMYRTLKENLGVENVYYTANGGKELYLADLTPVDTIAKDAPFMGSTYYADQNAG